ncbi:hypothetical protein EJ08DRAFT_492612 [Tothia fuscella]|uniref:DUF4211 domain-containing protein n=1 Tax=Tothia fuscella TaxID=1048955 RepID=A0A9P4TT45_9PEZI|nr:hypothetical protein EJ08DRAFT_492612 [Tothia fuscella]
MVKSRADLITISGTKPKYSFASRLESESSEDDLVPVSSARHARTPNASASSKKRLRSTRSQAGPASSPTAHTRSGRKTKSPIVELSTQDDSDAEKQRERDLANDPLGIAEPETSGDEVSAMRSSPHKRIRRRAATPDFIELTSEEEDAVESDVSIGSLALRRKTKKGRKPIPDDKEEEESEEEAPSPRKGRLSQKSRKLTDREQEELDDDLEFLKSSPPPRLSKQKREPSAREKALQALKARRASQPGSSHADAYDVEEPKTEDEDEEEGIYRAENRRDMFLSESGDEDFIDQDGDNDTLGAPSTTQHLDMPLQFSAISRQKAKDLFKYVVEWMVQKKINPAFNMTDEIYELAFRKLDDEVKGLAGSKFISAAWTLDFTRSVQARPDIVVTAISADLFDHCEACNRSGHPATFEIQFTGRPYHPLTLEEIDQGSEDEDDDEDEDEGEEHQDDKTEVDHKGNAVPPANLAYKCGVHCKENATTAHALQHWRYHLNEHIVAYLTEQRYLTSAKIVKRDGQSTKQRRKEANKIVDEMWASGKIRGIYDEFRSEINWAREAKSGWSRRERDYGV